MSLCKYSSYSNPLVRGSQKSFSPNLIVPRICFCCWLYIELKVCRSGCLHVFPFLSPFSLTLPPFPLKAICVFFFFLWSKCSFDSFKCWRVPKQSASEMKLTKPLTVTLCSRSAVMIAALSLSPQEVAAVFHLWKPACSSLHKSDSAELESVLQWKECGSPAFSMKTCVGW